jgi:hypothetical protein
MKKIHLALFLGVFAGIIDIIPMAIQGFNSYAIASAFLQWLILGFFISYIEFGIQGWCKGLIVAVLMALPIIIIVMKDDVASVLPILVMSAVLGSFIGFMSKKYGTEESLHFLKKSTNL